MTVTSVTVDWAQGASVSGRLVQGTRRLGVLLAHGAGTDQDHPSLIALRDGIASGGHPVMTFNYPYTERGARRPDPQARLLACHAAVLEWFREHVCREVVGAGRSMGGRMSTYLAADGAPFVGLILLAYPLHPAGKPDRLRADHLPDVPVPMLFVTGTRDPLSRMDLFDQWVRPLPRADVLLVEDGDHSFRVRKSSGRTTEEALDAIIESTLKWLADQESG